MEGAGSERDRKSVRPGNSDDHGAERQPAQTEIHRSVVDQRDGACAGERRRRILPRSRPQSRGRRRRTERTRFLPHPGRRRTRSGSFIYSINSSISSLFFFFYWHFGLDPNEQETAEFNLDASSGELRTRMTLDRESRSSYELLLVAKDRGIQTSYETLRLLTVIVDDANDNEPEFPAERRSLQLILFKNPKESSEIHRKSFQNPKESSEILKISFNIPKRSHKIPKIP